MRQLYSICAFIFCIQFVYSQNNALEKLFSDVPHPSFNALNIDREQVIKENENHGESYMSFKQEGDNQLSCFLALYSSGQTQYLLIHEQVSADCDQYYTTAYSYSTNEWKECTNDILPPLFCMLYFDDSAPVPTTRICFDQNVLWEYSYKDQSTLQVRPIPFADNMCFDSYLTNLDNWESEEQYRKEMQIYHNTLDNRKYDALLLKWNEETATFVFSEKVLR